MIEKQDTGSLPEEMSPSNAAKPSGKNEKSTKPSKPMGDGSPPPMRNALAWVLVAVMVLSLLHFLRSGKEAYQEIPYSPDFVEMVKDGRIREVEVVAEVSGVTYVRGKVVAAEEGDDQPARIKVYIRRSDEELQRFLLEHNVGFSYPPQNPFMYQLLSSVLPIVLIFGLLYFLFMRQIRSAGHGALSFGKSRARLLNREKNRITFENVAGIDEAREEVQEIIEFLKDPKRFQKLGGRIPKGVLLMGPPGTGKTLLAKAIAGEADVPFFSISGSDFVEMFVGVGASRVRDMFEQGKKNAPCIIFVDEIDAVGRSRFTGIGGGHDEREQTLNALLVEMDGFETQEGVIILAATNRPDVLDPALLRPGRFDRQIVIDLPNIDGREQILKIHSKALTLEPNVDFRRMARGTPGFSGADLENLLNEAALLAARDNKKAIDMVSLEEARDKVKWGRERRSRVLDDDEKKNTAYHEAGHALVMQMVDGSEPLHKITIIPRGVAYLGATMQLPERDRYTERRTELLGILAGLMGGRAAESEVFGDVTTGASSDLKQATMIAHNMVCTWGMSDTLGPQTFGKNEELMFLGREINRTRDYSEKTAQYIDEEVSRILRDAYKMAVTILRENRDKLDMIVERLLELETIDGRDVEDIVKYGRVRSEEEREPERREPEPSGESIPPSTLPDPGAGAVPEEGSGAKNEPPAAAAPPAGAE